MRSSDGTEVPAALRLLAGALDQFETFLSESGCPLTDDQRAAFNDARRDLSEQTGALA